MECVEIEKQKQWNIRDILTQYEQQLRSRNISYKSPSRNNSPLNTNGSMFGFFSLANSSPPREASKQAATITPSNTIAIEDQEMLLKEFHFLRDLILEALEMTTSASSSASSTTSSSFQSPKKDVEDEVKYAHIVMKRPGE